MNKLYGMTKQHALVIALLVSLGLNLLIAGVFLGRAGQGHQEPPPMNWAGKQLNPQTQQLLRRRMRAQLPEVRPLREEMRVASLHLRKAIGAEAFDRQALAEALARKRDVDQRYQALIHENLVDLAAELPRDQRMALIAAVLQRAQGGRPARRPPGEGPPANRGP